MTTLITHTTPPPSPANYADEIQKIYISKATLQLKQNFDTYEWHTMVRTSSPATPPTTPTTPKASTTTTTPAKAGPSAAEVADVLTPPETSEVLDKEVVEQQCEMMTRQQQKPLSAATILNRQSQAFAKGRRNDRPQTISTIVDNFIDSERYHSTCYRPTQDNAVETSQL